MWWFDALADGFTVHTHDAQLQYVRIAAGLAIALKFADSFLAGGWTRLSEDTYSRYLVMRQHGRKRGAAICAAYRPVLIIRIFAAISFLAGIESKISGLLVILGLAFEQTYFARFNTIYLALLVAALLCAGDLGSGFPVSGAVESSRNTWAQFLVVLLVLDMYWNSVWIKAKSRHFRSGLLLAQWLQTGAAVRSRLRYWEFFYPRLLLDRLGHTRPDSLRIWQAACWSVLVVEAILPVGLIFDATRPAAAVAGIIMHAGFTILMPRALIGFSVGTVASYAAFIG